MRCSHKENSMRVNGCHYAYSILIRCGGCKHNHLSSIWTCSRCVRHVLVEYHYADYLFLFLYLRIWWGTYSASTWCLLHLTMSETIETCSGWITWCHSVLEIMMRKYSSSTCCLVKPLWSIPESLSSHFFLRAWCTVKNLQVGLKCWLPL